MAHNGHDNTATRLPFSSLFPFLAFSTPVTFIIPTARWQGVTCSRFFKGSSLRRVRSSGTYGSTDEKKYLSNLMFPRSARWAGHTNYAPNSRLTIFEFVTQHHWYAYTLLITMIKNKQTTTKNRVNTIKNIVANENREFSSHAFIMAGITFVTTPTLPLQMRFKIQHKNTLKYSTFHRAYYNIVSLKNARTHTYTYYNNNKKPSRSAGADDPV